LQETTTSHLTVLLKKKRVEEKLILIANQSYLNFLFFIGQKRDQEEIKISEMKQLLIGSMVHLFKEGINRVWRIYTKHKSG